jgi:hypothetical protein
MEIEVKAGRGYLIYVQTHNFFHLNFMGGLMNI